MPITVAYTPTPSLMGTAAHQAGLGEYQKYLEQMQLERDRMAQTERMQNTSLDAQRQMQQAQIQATGANLQKQLLSSGFLQGQSLDAQRQRQAEALSAEQANQMRSLLAQRDSLEYSTSQAQEEAARQRSFTSEEAAKARSFDELKTKYLQENSNWQLQQRLQAEQQNLANQLQVSRMNNLSGIAGEITRTQMQGMYSLYGQQQTIAGALARDYNQAGYNYDLANQRGDIQAYLQGQEYDYRSLLESQQFDQQAQLYETQAQAQSERDLNKLSALQQAKFDEIHQAQIELEAMRDDLTPQMYEQFQVQIANRIAGIKNAKDTIRKPPYPEGTNLGDPPFILNGQDQQPIIDPRTNQPMLWLRSANGETTPAFQKIPDEQARTVKLEENKRRREESQIKMFSDFISQSGRYPTQDEFRAMQSGYAAIRSGEPNAWQGYQPPAANGVLGSGGGDFQSSAAGGGDFGNDGAMSGGSFAPLYRSNAAAGAQAAAMPILASPMAGQLTPQAAQEYSRAIPSLLQKQQYFQQTGNQPAAIAAAQSARMLQTAIENGTTLNAKDMQILNAYGQRIQRAMPK